MVGNPIRKRKDGWYWGGTGPFPTRKKAAEVARAAYSSGYKGNPIQYYRVTLRTPEGKRRSFWAIKEASGPKLTIYIPVNREGRDFSHYEGDVLIEKKELVYNSLIISEKPAIISKEYGWLEVKKNPTRELVPVRVTPPEKRIERVVPLKTVEDMTPEEYDREIRRREIPRRWRPNPVTGPSLGGILMIVGGLFLLKRLSDSHA